MLAIIIHIRRSPPIGLGLRSKIVAIVVAVIIAVVVGLKKSLLLKY